MPLPKSILSRLCCIETKLRTLWNWFLTQASGSADALIEVDEDTVLTRANITVAVWSWTGERDITLPEATFFNGSRVSVKRKGDGGEVVHVIPSNGDLIDGQSEVLLGNDWASVSLRAAEGSWLMTASVNL